MAIGYTKKMFIQRIKQHIANGFPSTDFSSTDNEVLLYIDEALASTIVGQVYLNAKIEGTLVMPEAYLITYLLTDLQQDNITKYWYSTLPQPPLNLPLGYSINRCYFANSVNGIGKEVLPIKASRTGYRLNMPMPTGVRYWVENKKIWIAASDGSSLLNQPLYVQMPSSRTEDVNDVMAIPDDALEQIFTKVTGRLIQRLQLPKDVIQDDISEGNKTS